MSFLLVVSAFFLCAGSVLIRYPGLQNDEVFFAPPIFQPLTAFYSVRFAGMRIPLMVMSYTGALKTWLYTAIFSAWDPSRWSVRVPMLLACLLTIWLTWLWARALGGTRTAVAATALLATDAMFLLTGVFDWGPVALQHLFLVAGLVCLSRYLHSSSRPMLALGFFLWGLGLWDKALMIWPLAGLAVATLAVYPRELRRRLTASTAAIALASLCLGAAPLIWYNLDRHGETASANAVISTDDYREKLTALERTLNGSDLFGYMVEERPISPTRPPRGVVERVSLAVRGVAGSRMRNWFLPAFAASIAVLFWLRRSRQFRPMLFLLVAMAVAWLQMFVTHLAGSAAHHIVLLWPLPFVFTGLALVAIAESSRRYRFPIFAAVLSVLVLGNVLNENEYLARFAMRGGIGGWSDAIFALSDNLDDSRWVGTVDWGFLNSLRVLHRGRIKLFNASDFLTRPQLDQADRAELKKMITTPDFVYVEHTAGREIIPHVNEMFRKRASEFGYSEGVTQVISDSSGAPVFELFHFKPAEENAALRQKSEMAAIGR